MGDIGKWLFLMGCGLAFLGALFWIGTKFGLPVGKLPGDLRVSGENYSFYFPIVTSIIVSILLTVVVNIMIAIFRK